ncbi:MAG: hypothetical protein R8M45_10995 [Ghiorsea sp.]
MDMNFDHAFWGVLFAGIFYVLGNAAWTNKWARQKRVVGVMLWAVLGVLTLVLAAVFDMRLDPNLQMPVGERMATVDGENHWIALTLYALLSVPGLAANLFSLDLRLTRLALVVPALVVFIPMGKQLEHPEGSLLLFSMLAALLVIGVLLVLQMLLDVEPAQKGQKQEATV